MRVVNLTPHPVHLLDNGGAVVREFAPSGVVLRVPEVVEPAGELVVNGAAVPVVRKRLAWGQCELPQPEDGVFYIVSLPAAQAARRKDFLVPDDLVRDEKGRVLGCRRFAVVA